MITVLKQDATTDNFLQFRVSGDKAVFIGPNHTDFLIDTLTLQASEPKRGNNQFGNRRTDVSLIRGTQVVDLEGQSVIRNRKMAISNSLPVGTSFDDLKEDAFQMSELLKNEDFLRALFTQGIIEH